MHKIRAMTRNTLSITLAYLSLVATGNAQNLDVPDGQTVIRVLGAGRLYSVGDANQDGFDDLGRVNVRSNPSDGNCLGLLTGATSSPADRTIPAAGGQFCSQDNAGEYLRAPIFTTNFCGVGTRSLIFQSSGLPTNDGSIHTLPKSGTVSLQALLRCPGNVELISNVGDLNNDGSDDFWMGNDQGSGRMQFGRPTSTTGEYCIETPGARIHNCDGGLITGIVGTAEGFPVGDLDGDGQRDLGLAAGSSLVVLFRRDAAIDLSSLLPTDGIRFTSASSGTVGRALGGVDLNSDSINDLVIAFPDASPNGISSAGRVFIVYGTGQPAASATDLDLPAPNIRQIAGGAQLQLLGRFIRAGDFDNDGQTDLVIGSSANGIYVLYGGPGRKLVNGSPDQNQPNMIRIPGSTAQFVPIEGPFDFNSDGFDDFGVLAGNDNYYVVLGRSNQLFKDSFE